MSQEKRNKRTKQREAILKALRRTDTHPTAFWLYEQVRKDMPNVSLGTVYRNLNLLRDKGQITQLNFVPNFTRFDGRTDRHDHLICNGCNHVFDLPATAGSEFDQQVARATGNTIFSHNIQFEGLCPNCMK